MHCYTIPDTMYNSNILLVVNCNKDKMLDAIEKHCGVGRQTVSINETSAAGVFSIANKDKQTVYIIWIEKYDGGVKTQSDLVHECLHFVNWLLDDRGIKFHLDSDDVQCYYMGHIFANCYGTLKQNIKGNK